MTECPVLDLFTDILINSDIPGAKEVQKELGTDIEFCSVPVELDANGAKSVKPIGKVYVPTLV